MSNICNKLHEVTREGQHFNFTTGYRDIPKNGIYIMFENGEFAHGGNRIVRIGTHTGDNQLPSRIYQHFENENKNRSIFRKNIGRCILHNQQDCYLSTWELDTTTKEKKLAFSHLIDKDKEATIEKQISQYIQENLSFCLLEIPDKDNRIYYESRLIGTVSNCNECTSSENWFGRFSPVEKIVKSGIWQVMQLYSEPLSDNEIDFISKSIFRANV